MLEAPVGERATTVEGRTVNGIVQESVAQGGCVIACMGEKGHGNLGPRHDG